MSDVGETVQTSVEQSADAMQQAGEAAFAAMPQTEIPEAVRAAAERGVKQMRAAYDAMRSATEQAGGLIEESCGVTSRGLHELGLQFVEAARAQANASFDFAGALIGARSPSQALELQTAYARQQFETATTQTKDFAATATRLVADGAKPYRVMAERISKLAQV
jgi:phasin